MVIDRAEIICWDDGETQWPLAVFTNGRAEAVVGYIQEGWVSVLKSRNAAADDDELEQCADAASAFLRNVTSELPWVVELHDVDDAEKLPLKIVGIPHGMRWPGFQPERQSKPKNPLTIKVD